MCQSYLVSVPRKVSRARGPPDHIADDVERSTDSLTHLRVRAMHEKQAVRAQSRNLEEAGMELLVLDEMVKVEREKAYTELRGSGKALDREVGGFRVEVQ